MIGVDPDTSVMVVSLLPDPDDLRQINLEDRHREKIAFNSKTRFFTY